MQEQPSSLDTRLEGLVSDGGPLPPAQASRILDSSAAAAGKVEALYQYPEMPSGCELTSLAIVLHAFGFAVDKTELADNYLVVDGSEWGFLASPYDLNGGGFPPGIVDAANRFLKDKGASLAAHDLTGSDFDALSALVEAGYPVCVWTTLYLDEPNYDLAKGATDTWYVNEHCVVLYGSAPGKVLVSDPLQGLVEHELSQFARVYDQCGKMALALW